MDKTVKEIIDIKKSLFKDLEENVFKTFSNEEELLLHSKHGKIKVKVGNVEVANGIVGAFKQGLDCLVDGNPEKFTCLREINWIHHTFRDSQDHLYNFEFIPIKLSEL